ncbi:hypothetical protein KZZ52_01705 [Dactylosporangium sp. AC04546]|uniref:hypothetical protein n=1 Tax=Dactylosporangium sp. AC04546 TaxID=2862460 RepID=UPI001EE0339F|nr:hypothetical protein [Dactylosporangium sp. AC04546]WVK84177.1 hypothetical protein KZZ52_01705 [Dactylosporangium sp. AC04546]
MLIRRLALCGVLLLSACSKSDPPTDWSTVSAPPPNPKVMVHQGSRPANLELPFIRVLGKQEANLRWPNAGLHLEMIGATDTYPTDIEGRNATPPPKNPDEEWVIAYVGSAPDGTITTGFADALVKINGQPHQVPKFQSQAFIVVAAPKGATTRLEITDTERTQWIDLRTAETSTPIPGLYPRRRDSASFRCDIASPDKSINGSTVVFSANATLEPWAEARGWAKTGRVWMNLKLGLWYSRNGIAIAVDTPSALAITGPEGPVPVNLPLSLGGPNQDDPHTGAAELTVDVPADVAVAQVVFQLKGTITVKGAVVPQWTATCETKPDALAFNE